ncbi:S4 domain-containing protein YaaA [Thermoflavimicrobium daqui]|jgi:ribosome-associated protein|uniref:S4 domain-containing protein YaaA n=1 Tax=Thermoflavimicrobium daqui TaxID=2137476 RepID=A0A364K3N5_9BACL|nr:S4 domain-containing protein YaaA [Thermoflavimicrobium daqui]RAL23414.1 S4 domain-containing protein YaaA [Thermoflavimicrobium daqui]
MKKVKIDGPYITLGQLLKKIDLIDSGGQARIFLDMTEVKVNGEHELRRGRKIYPQDIVDIAGHGKMHIIQV